MLLIDKKIDPIGSKKIFLVSVHSDIGGLFLAMMVA